LKLKRKPDSAREKSAKAQSLVIRLLSGFSLCCS